MHRSHGARRPRDAATAYTAPPRQTRTHRKPTVHTERDERAPEMRGETINMYRINPHSAL